MQGSYGNYKPGGYSGLGGGIGGGIGGGGMGSGGIGAGTDPYQNPVNY